MFDGFWLSVPVQLIAWKDSSPNDLLCVEWDVKPYTLTHPCSSPTLMVVDSCSGVADGQKWCREDEHEVHYFCKLHRTGYASTGSYKFVSTSSALLSTSAQCTC